MIFISDTMAMEIGDALFPNNSATGDEETIIVEFLWNETFRNVKHAVKCILDTDRASFEEGWGSGSLA